MASKAQNSGTPADAGSAIPEGFSTPVAGKSGYVDTASAEVLATGFGSDWFIGQPVGAEVPVSFKLADLPEYPASLANNVKYDVSVIARAAVGDRRPGYRVGIVRKSLAMDTTTRLASVRVVWKSVTTDEG